MFCLTSQSQSSSKFSDRWEGPYRVTKIASNENVELLDIKNVQMNAKLVSTICFFLTFLPVNSIVTSVLH